MISPLTNRGNVGLGNFPLLYPEAGIVPAGQLSGESAPAANAPFYVDGRVDMAPTLPGAAAYQQQTPPNLLYNTGGFLDMVRTNNVADQRDDADGPAHGQSRLPARSQLEAAEQLGKPEAVPGQLNFGNDSNNPLDSGFGFANAALGIFSSYAQINALFEGNFIYDSHEFYIQDNWKVNNRLTLDYGMRFTHQGPNYDTKLQASNFFPDQWSRAAAPQLYMPGCAVATRPVPGRESRGRESGDRRLARRRARRWRSARSCRTAATCQRHHQAGDGIAKKNYTWPTLGFAPRFGAAYDVTGTQRMVVRGSVRRLLRSAEGQHGLQPVGNPPVGRSTTSGTATCSARAVRHSVTQTPSSMTIFYYDSELPTSLQWNVGAQMALPWASSLDISYVGSHSYNILGVEPRRQRARIIGVGVPAAEPGSDAVEHVPGAAALATDLLRPYRGLGAIITTWGKNWNGYDSIQMASTAGSATACRRP